MNIATINRTQAAKRAADAADAQRTSAQNSHIALKNRAISLARAAFGYSAVDNYADSTVKIENVTYDLTDQTQQDAFFSAVAEKFETNARRDRDAAGQIEAANLLLKTALDHIARADEDAAEPIE